jgi:Trk K+ transport system NAD-binding subunit
MADRRTRRTPRTIALYVRALGIEFRGTLAALAGIVLAGGLLHAWLSRPADGPRRLATSFYDAWMSLFGENVLSPADPWPLQAVFALYPLIGFVVIGEGIVRLALLITSKHHGEQGWMKVEASTYRDHVVICGIGHLGFRVLQQLAAAGAAVVAVEKDPEARFLAQAKAAGVPVLIRDMKDDAALADAGVPHARAIVIASNDDMANLEVALDARRMNPKIRILMRLFDQQIATKIAGAMAIDVAFSSSSLAAPMVAAMTLGSRVLASFAVGGAPHVTAEVTVGRPGGLDGRTVGEIEQAHGARVLARTPPGGAPEAPPPPGARVAAGDTLVVHAPAARMAGISAAAEGAMIPL